MNINKLYLSVCLMIFAWLYGVCIKGNVDINEVVFDFCSKQGV